MNVLGAAFVAARTTVDTTALRTRETIFSAIENLSATVEFATQKNIDIREGADKALLLASITVLGKSWSSWGSTVCNTPDCGIVCLESSEKGVGHTALEQGGTTFSVNSLCLRDIATAAEEQPAASEQISQSMEGVNNIAGDVSSAQHEAAGAVEDMSSHAAQLGKIINGLRAG